MMTIDTAHNPLDFAWLAAQRIRDADWQIIRLREVARAFDKSGNHDNQVKAFSALSEAHVTLTEKIAEDGFHVPGDLEALAIDFATIGHKTEALAVLTEALDCPLRSKDTFVESIHNPLPSGGEMRVVMLGENANAYLAIGEPDLATPLMHEAWALTIKLSPAYRPFDCWVQPLLTAFLKTGVTARAWRLARSFKGIDKVEALAAMALHGRKNGYGRKKLLEASITIMENLKGTFFRELYAYRIALMLAERDIFGPEKRLRKMIKDGYYLSKSAIAIAEVHYRKGEIKPAVSMLKRAARSADKIDGGCGHLTIWAKLVASYEKLGNREAALQFVDMIRVKADDCTDLKYRCWLNNLLIGVYTCVGRRQEAEECVDEVLDADLIGLEELNANTYAHPAVTLLYDLSMAIAEHGLEFSGERRRKFTQLLASLPEYPDRFPDIKRSGDKVKISKFLSLVLRHRPGVVGVRLDEAGWAEIAELVEKACKAGVQLTPERICQVVADSDKQRFAISEDGLRVRLNQGHSIAVDLGLEKAEPPPLLYHGTASRNLAAIRQQGLIKGNRQHVHLSADKETAEMVGKRFGKPVVLTIKAGCMHRDGFGFYLSVNGVWLTNHVPTEYIKVHQKV